MCDGAEGVEPAAGDGEEEEACGGCCEGGRGLEDPAVEPEGVLCAEVEEGEHVALCEDDASVHCHVHGVYLPGPVCYLPTCLCLSLLVRACR